MNLTVQYNKAFVSHMQACFLLYFKTVVKLLREDCISQTAA